MGRRFALTSLVLALCVACEGPLGTGAEDAWLGSLQGDAAPLATGVRVRLMAANLTSGDQQSYDTGHGGRLMQGVAPDIVLIQEFNYGENSPAELRAFVDSYFTPAHAFAREERSSLPNGVISRFPIVASGTWRDPTVPNRDFFWARIDVPGDADLWAVSVHLASGGVAKRKQAAGELARKLNEYVPQGDYVVVGGDFNTGGRTEASVRALADLLVTSGPYPMDQRGNGNTSASRSKPLDWLLFNEALQRRASPVVLGSNTFPSGLVLDSRVYSPLDELYPVRPSDSGARAMQHMGVVRDVML